MFQEALGSRVSYPREAQGESPGRYGKILLTRAVRELFEELTFTCYLGHELIRGSSVS